MQQLLLAGVIAVMSVIWWPTPYALAQDAKVARGRVTAISANTLTVTVRGVDMQFAVDAKTMVEARGAGTKARAAASRGMPGPKLADVLRVGEGVAVTYHDLNGTLHASHVRSVPNVAAASAVAASTFATGTLQSIGNGSITIAGSSGGGGTFSQTFAVDESTRVVVKGATAASPSHDGKAPVTRLLSVGDRVSVSYQKHGATLHATNVRVTQKAMASASMR